MSIGKLTKICMIGSIVFMSGCTSTSKDDDFPKECSKIIQWCKMDQTDTTGKKICAAVKDKMDLEGNEINSLRCIQLEEKYALHKLDKPKSSLKNKDIGLTYQKKRIVELQNECYRGVIDYFDTPHEDSKGKIFSSRFPPKMDEFICPGESSFKNPPSNPSFFQKKLFEKGGKGSTFREIGLVIEGPISACFRLHSSKPGETPDSLLDGFRCEALSDLNRDGRPEYTYKEAWYSIRTSSFESYTYYKHISSEPPKSKVDVPEVAIIKQRRLFRGLLEILNENKEDCKQAANIASKYLAEKEEEIKEVKKEMEGWSVGYSFDGDEAMKKRIEAITSELVGELEEIVKHLRKKCPEKIESIVEVIMKIEY